MGYPNITDLEIHKISIELGERVFKECSRWERLHLNTIGYQLIRSCDSIAANIAEGYGRYSFKESKRFCYFARGSLFETQTWLLKAHNR